MKKIFINFCLVMGLLIGFSSCETDDIGYYKEGYDAVRFPATTLYGLERAGYNSESQLFLASFSFIDSPFVSDTIYRLPVILIGNKSNVDRSISYRIDEEKSNAPADAYKILEAVIPADTTVGYIHVQLMNRQELNDTTYQLYLTLEGTNELSKGPKEYITAMLSWNNAIPMPTNTNFIRTYNMLIQSSLNFVATSTANYSPNALKAIVAALGWNDWDDINVHGNKYNAPSVGSYKYLPRYTWIYSDNSYKSYALKLKDYLNAYNAVHPDAPLKHDAGGLKGQLIEARSY